MVSALEITGDVHHRSAVIVDVMITTGATIKAAVGLLAARGPDIVVAATHGLFVYAAASRLGHLDLRRILMTDTVLRPRTGLARSRCARSR